MSSYYKISSSALMCFMVILVGLLPLSANAQELKQSRPKFNIYAFDFIIMKPGHDLKERDEYDAKVLPSTFRHGITRIASIKILQPLAAPSDLRRLDIYSLKRPNGLASWANDPDFQRHTSLRQRIVDDQRETVYIGVSSFSPQTIKNGIFLIEVLKFRPDLEQKNLTDYLAKADTNAQEFSVARIASFAQLKRLSGGGPNANWINLWFVPNQTALTQWVGSHASRQLSTQRAKLFDPTKQMVLLGQAIAQKPVEPK